MQLFRDRHALSSQWQQQHHQQQPRIWPLGKVVPRRSVHRNATRDLDFAYQKDIQTKLKPGEFLERQEDRFKVVLEAKDWRVVAAMFTEMGADIERKPALIAEMLAALQRLVPQQQQQQQQQQQAAGIGSIAGSSSSSSKLSQQDAAALAVNVTKMSLTLVDNVTKLNSRAFSTAAWALAQLPDPAKTLGTPVAKTARSKVVAALGAYAIGSIHRMKAEEIFHLLAGLHLLGFKAPERLEPKPRVNREGKLVAGGAATSFAGLLESRSTKTMVYLDHKTLADAAFVVSRMVKPASMSAGWLQLFAQMSKQFLSEMQPEALVHAGYALARNGHLPSNSWRKAYLKALQGFAKVLSGEEFPLVLFTLARWQQQEAEQPQQDQLDDDLEDDQEEEGSYNAAGLDPQEFTAGAALHPAAAVAAAAAAAAAASGRHYNPATAPGQQLIDELLLASYTNRALREMPLGQVAVMLQALAGLQRLIGITINPLWLKRVWPAVNAKINAAAAAGSSSSSIAADLADVLAALPLLDPQPELPQDFVEGLVGNLGLGLQAVNPAKLAAACYALQQLQHRPDAIFVRQAQSALLAAVPVASMHELPQLLKAGFAVADAAATPAAGSSEQAAASSSSSGAGGIRSGPEFCEAMLQAVTAAFQKHLKAAVAALSRTAIPIGSSSSSSGSKAAKEEQLAKQQQQRVEAVQAGGQQGLWRAPVLVRQMLSATTAAATAASSSNSSSSAGGSSQGSTAAVLQDHVPVLQQLWQQAAVQVAAAAPTVQLLDLLNDIVDMPESASRLLGIEHTAAGLKGEQQRQPGDFRSKLAVLAAMLRESVVAGIEEDRARKSKTKASAAAAATAHQLGISNPSGSFAYSFTVDYADQLLLILTDSGLAQQQQQAVPEVQQIVQAAADVLSGAIADKGPAYGLSCTSAEAQNLLAGLRDDYGSVNKRLQARFDTWHAKVLMQEAEARAAEEAAAAAAAAADSYSHLGDQGFQQQQYGQQQYGGQRMGQFGQRQYS